MTISYDGFFVRLLLRWKGSIWKNCWFELMIWLFCYYILRFIYKLVLNDEQKLHFEHISLTWDSYADKMPITFLLGFYINLIVTRWWSQFELIAWPDDLLSFINAIFPGTEQRETCIRIRIARYLLLTSTLVWRDISTRIRSRFPFDKNLVTAGLMTEEELKLYKEIKEDAVKWQLPLGWIQRLMEEKARANELPAPIYSGFLNELIHFRTSMRKLYCYDWVCVPLVYTQVAALATYAYFAFLLMGRQYLDQTRHYKNNDFDLYVPVFSIVQFIFFIGWFKVGQELLHPFGTADDQLELNYILERHYSTCVGLVKHINEKTPVTPVEMEINFLEKLPNLPHTTLSAKYRDHQPKLHAFIKPNQLFTAQVLPQPCSKVNITDDEEKEYKGLQKVIKKVEEMFSVISSRGHKEKRIRRF